MSSIKIDLTEMRKLSGLGPQFPEWHLHEHYENLASPPESPEDRYDANDGDLNHVQLYREHSHLRLEFWYDADVQMHNEGGNALPERVNVKDVEEALELVNDEAKLDTKLTDKDKQTIRDYWEQEVIRGREGNITLFFVTKGKKTRFDHTDVSG
jgi:hypothetical protein